MLNQEEASSEVLLKVHDRVVWLSDYGPEYGIVKWIGHLPEAETKELIAGIEFVSLFCFLLWKFCCSKGGESESGIWPGHSLLKEEQTYFRDAFFKAAKKSQWRAFYISIYTRQ